MAKISDLQADVKRKLANRQDSYDLAPFFIRDAIRELTESYSFTELEEIEFGFQLIANVARYDVSNFVSADIPFTDIKAFDLYTDYPNNTVSKNVKFRELMVVLPMAKISALPSVWTRHGSWIIFGNAPDNPYTIDTYYQRKHYFEGPTVEALRETEIRMPDSWLEIVTLSAAERGAMELRLPDFVSLYHSILFGDPKKPGEPGLIQARVSQHERDKGHNEGQMTPQVQRYT